MNITSIILNNINESEVDTNSSKALSVITKGIKFLINDEKEAYRGYNQFLSDISENVSEELYEKIKKIIIHISDEEQEHIKELEELYEELRNEIK